MGTYPECFPCFLNQALRAGTIATDHEEKIKRLLDELGMMLRNIPFESIPPESGRLIYQKVIEITGNSDLYRFLKPRRYPAWHINNLCVGKAVANVVPKMKII